MEATTKTNTGVHAMSQLSVTEIGSCYPLAGESPARSLPVSLVLPTSLSRQSKGFEYLSPVPSDGMAQSIVNIAKMALELAVLIAAERVKETGKRGPRLHGLYEVMARAGAL